jgi:hypothetical protein
MDAHRHASVRGQLQEFSRQDNHVGAGGMMRSTIPPPFAVVVAAIERDSQTYPWNCILPLSLKLRSYPT